MNAGRQVVPGPDRAALFEQAVLPHLNAAYNLARWLTRNPDDAADVVQEAYLRALRYFDGFAGEDGKAWLLSIVRHTCFTWLRRNRPAELAPLPEETEGGPRAPGAFPPRSGPGPSFWRRRGGWGGGRPGPPARPRRPGRRPAGWPRGGRWRSPPPRCSRWFWPAASAISAAWVDRGTPWCRMWSTAMSARCRPSI